MTDTPTWLLMLTPVGAFLGVLVGQWVARRADKEIGLRWRREETMRTMRWAAEKATDANPRSSDLGMTALIALSGSELLQPEDEAFIDLVVKSLLRTPVEEYREAGTTAEVVELEPDVAIPRRGDGVDVRGEGG